MPTPNFIIRICTFTQVLDLCTLPTTESTEPEDKLLNVIFFFFMIP